MRWLLALLGVPSSAEPYFIERSDAEVESLLLESISNSAGHSLSLGNSIIHGLRIPWEQARRTIENLKTKGLIDYELPHNTWIKAVRI